MIPLESLVKNAGASHNFISLENEIRLARSIFNNHCVNNNLISLENEIRLARYTLNNYCVNNKFKYNDSSLGPQMVNATISAPQAVMNQAAASQLIPPTISAGVEL